MTWRNTERTGQRYVPRLSTAARKITGVRHTDLDLTQWCPKCRKPQVFAEVKKREAPDTEWDQARRHARFYGHGCIAILVTEKEDSTGVKVYNPEHDTILPAVREAGEGYLIRVLEHARDIHACWV